VKVEVLLTQSVELGTEKTRPTFHCLIVSPLAKQLLVPQHLLSIHPRLYESPQSCSQIRQNILGLGLCLTSFGEATFFSFGSILNQRVRRNQIKGFHWLGFVVYVTPDVPAMLLKPQVIAFLDFMAFIDPRETLSTSPRSQTTMLLWAIWIFWPVLFSIGSLGVSLFNKPDTVHEVLLIAHKIYYVTGQGWRSTLISGRATG